MKNRTDGKNETKKPKHEAGDIEQSKRFIQTAKELEADKNAEAFERALGIVAPPKMPPKND